MMQWKSLIVSWLCWVLLSCTFLALRPVESYLTLWNDSFQYLSVAQNLLAGRGTESSILIYDEQFYSGRIPGPQTVFPPAYPALTAAVAFFGVPLELSGEIISLVSFWLIIFLLLVGSRMLQLSPNATRVVLFLCVANSAMWRFATTVLTEELFTAVVLASLLALAAAESTRAKEFSRIWLLAGGSILAGATYWIRNAGLFVIVGLGAYFFIKWLTRRDRKSFADLVLYGAASCGLVLLGMMRNLALSGTLRGGNAETLNNPVTRLAYDLCSSAVKLTIGYTWTHHMLKPFSVQAAMVFGLSVLVGAAAFVWIVVLVVRRRSANRTASPLPILCACCIAVYTAFVIYCGKYTPISLGEPRMFVPLIPMIVLLIGWLISRVAWDRVSPGGLRLCKTAAIIFCLGYAASHLATEQTCIGREGFASESQRVCLLLKSPLQDGCSPFDWIAKNIAKDEPVFATVQAVGYVFQRGVICVGAWDVKRAWDADRVYEAAKQYGVKYLILFPNAEEATLAAKRSPFIAALLDEKLPPWVSVAAKSDTCVIYRLEIGR